MTALLQGFANLLASKKAVAGGLLVICATVLVALNYLAIEEWTEYTKWLFITYVAGETTSGVTAMVTGSKREKAASKKKETEEEDGRANAA